MTIKTVGDITVGPNTKSFSKDGNYERNVIHIPNFENLAHAADECIETDTFTAHGEEWTLQVYPSGQPGYSYVSLYLIYAGNKTSANPVLTKFIIHTNSRNLPIPFHSFSTSVKSIGWPNFHPRSSIISKDLDSNGTLKINIDIEISTEKNKILLRIPPRAEGMWSFPQLEPEPTLVALYDSIEMLGDVTFVVDGKSFKLHRFILAIHAKYLYESSRIKGIDDDGDDDHDGISIELEGVDATTFQAMIEFIYKHTKPAIQNDEDAKLLLDMADRYGCYGLKLYVETVVVQKLLSPSNAASWLSFAHAHALPLLKEAAMLEYIQQPTVVMAASNAGRDWQTIEECPALLAELLRYQNVDRVHPEHVNVSTLRTQIQELGRPLADLDGTREMLMKRVAKS